MQQPEVESPVKAESHTDVGSPVHNESPARAEPLVKVESPTMEHESKRRLGPEGSGVVSESEGSLPSSESECVLA